MAGLMGGAVPAEDAHPRRGDGKKWRHFADADEDLQHHRGEGIGSMAGQWQDNGGTVAGSGGTVAGSGGTMAGQWWDNGGTREAMGSIGVKMNIYGGTRGNRGTVEIRSVFLAE